MKTLAIRLQDDQHARLSLLAKVSGINVTDLIRSAIETRLDALAADGEIAEKAKAVLDEIDRQASAERDAITALIGAPATAKAVKSRTTGNS
jgi:predicted DNA-binding protein